jgi:hypothetical protein
VKQERQRARPPRNSWVLLRRRLLQPDYDR